MSFYKTGEQSGGNYESIAAAQTKMLSSEVVGGCMGTWAGIYASGNGVDCRNAALFTWFEYEILPENLSVRCMFRISATGYRYFQNWTDIYKNNFGGHGKCPREVDIVPRFPRGERSEPFCCAKIRNAAKPYHGRCYTIINMWKVNLWD